MIKRIRIRNFLSLKDTTVNLDQFNVFVGPNGAGKSAFFKALVTLSKLLHQPLRAQNRDEFRIGEASNLGRLVREGNENLPILFDIWFDSSQYEPQYSIEIRKLSMGWSVTREQLKINDFKFDSYGDVLTFETEFKGTQTLEPPYPGTLSSLLFKFRNDKAAQNKINPFLQITEMVGSSWRYRITPNNIADTVYPMQDRESQDKVIYVGENGWGLPWVLRRLLGEERSTFLMIENQLINWFPHINSIEFEEAKNGIRLSFKTTHSQKPVLAELESDGILTGLFLLWRLHNPEKNIIICLEEPENSTHPYYLKTRYEYMKNIATDSNFLNRQLLISTHSPDFLDAIGADDGLKVLRITEYSTQKGTVISDLGSIKEFKTLSEIFRGNLGEMWWSGAIGGIPKNE